MSYLMTKDPERYPITEDMLRVKVPSLFATEAHESRSERFSYIPSWGVIEALQREGFVVVCAQQNRTRIPGKAAFTKHLLRLRHPEYGAKCVGGVTPEIVFENAHDGTSAYRLMAGLYRLICTNGMVVADSRVEAVHVRHMGFIEDKVIEGSFRIIGEAVKAAEVAPEWSQIQLNASEREAFANAAAQYRFGESQNRIAPKQLLVPRRQADTANDLWHVFNRIQENTTQGGLPTGMRESRRRNITRRITAIDKNVKLNQALWSMAEKMAAIKKAA